MDLIMDGLLIAGALFAGCYCWVLSRRVRALQRLDAGLGGAITQMTRQIEEARRALEEAKAANRDGRQELKELTTRADASAGQLRILLAASRDLAVQAPRPLAGRQGPPRPPVEATGATERADPAGQPPAPEADEFVPKPYRFPPVASLRPRQPAPPPPPEPRSEDDILAALTAIATSERA